MQIRPLPRVLIGFGAAIVLLDLAAAVASLRFGFDYERIAWVSYALYALAGFFAARCGGVVLGALGGALTSLVDATIGWGVSWVLGPGRPPGGWPGFGFVAYVAGVVVLYGTVLGLGGGLFSLLYSWARVRGGQRG